MTRDIAATTPAEYAVLTSEHWKGTFCKALCWLLNCRKQVATSAVGGPSQASYLLLALLNLEAIRLKEDATQDVDAERSEFLVMALPSLSWAVELSISCMATAAPRDFVHIVHLLHFAARRDQGALALLAYHNVLDPVAKWIQCC
eukprot:129465-Amphidinium_carterae.1